MSKIVVGVDGSEESAQALSWAADEARLRDSQLEGLAMEGIERSQSQPGARSAEEMAREHADALVRSMLARRGRGTTYCGRRAQARPVPGRAIQGCRAPRGGLPWPGLGREHAVGVGQHSLRPSRGMPGGRHQVGGHVSHLAPRREVRTIRV